DGKRLLEKDPIQSSEKFYEVVVESIKLLANLYGLDDILEEANKCGGWNVSLLENVVKRLKDKVKGLKEAWDAANYLHVWGFHEGKLNRESIEMRIPVIEDFLKNLEDIIKG
ncbi:MAG: hypothetical protein B6U89_02625, partial [Desulfurococcales archaeon ex4484_58]